MIVKYVNASAIAAPRSPSHQRSPPVASERRRCPHRRLESSKSSTSAARAVAARTAVACASWYVTTTDMIKIPCRMITNSRGTSVCNLQGGFPSRQDPHSRRREHDPDGVVLSEERDADPDEPEPSLVVCRQAALCRRTAAGSRPGPRAHRRSGTASPAPRPIEMPPASADPGEAPTARASYPSRMRLNTNQTTAAATRSPSATPTTGRTLERMPKKCPMSGIERVVRERVGPQVHVAGRSPSPS